MDPPFKKGFISRGGWREKVEEGRIDDDDERGNSLRDRPSRKWPPSTVGRESGDLLRSGGRGPRRDWRVKEVLAENNPGNRHVGKHPGSSREDSSRWP